MIPLALLREELAGGDDEARGVVVPVPYVHEELPAEGVQPQPAAEVEVIERAERGDGELRLADRLLAQPPEAEGAALPVDVARCVVEELCAGGHAGT